MNVSMSHSFLKFFDSPLKIIYHWENFEMNSQLEGQASTKRRTTVNVEVIFNELFRLMSRGFAWLLIVVYEMAFIYLLLTFRLRGGQL